MIKYVLLVFVCFFLVNSCVNTAHAYLSSGRAITFAFIAVVFLAVYIKVKWFE